MQQYFAAAADDGDDGDGDFVCMEVYSMYSGSRVYDYHLTPTSGDPDVCTSILPYYMPPLAFTLAA